MNAVAMMKAAVEMDPMDDVARLAYADALEEVGMDGQAKRERSAAGAIRRGENRGSALDRANVNFLKASVGFKGRRVVVRLATEAVVEGTAFRVELVEPDLITSQRLAGVRRRDVIALIAGEAIACRTLNAELDEWGAMVYHNCLEVWVHPDSWAMFAATSDQREPVSA